MGAGVTAPAIPLELPHARGGHRPPPAGGQRPLDGARSPRRSGRLLELVNHAPTAAEFKMELSGSERLRPQPASVTLSLAAGETKRLPIELRVDQPRPARDLPPLSYEWSARFDVEGQPLELHEHSSLPLYEPLALVQVPRPTTVDGQLDEWSKLRFQGKGSSPLPTGSATWTGFDDLDYQFGSPKGPSCVACTSRCSSRQPASPRPHLMLDGTVSWRCGPFNCASAPTRPARCARCPSTAPADGSADAAGPRAVCLRRAVRARALA
jgi:hypothetical protein